MSNALQFGRKAFTISVIGATVLWAVGVAALIPLQASAAASGDLVKASLPAVYYYASDGKRYVFPNEATYKTWYSDFSSVKKITDAELAAMPIGGNVTYKGTKATGFGVKINTSPTVYAVGANGSLLPIPDEATAKSLLGDNWNKKIHDVPDVFFSNYTVSTALAAGATTASLADVASNISSDKSLAAAPATPTPATGTVTVALNANTPAAAAAPFSSGDIVATKIDFTGTGKVKEVKVTRSGLSADADLSAVKLYDGTKQLGTHQTFNAAHQAVFVLTSAWEVSGTKTLTIAADVQTLAGGATAGNVVVLGIHSAADVKLESGSVGGTFPLKGNGMTVSSATIGSLTVANTGGANPTTNPGHDAGKATAIVLLEARLTGGAVENVEVTRFAALKSGTFIASDIAANGFELYDATNAKLLGTASLDADSRAVYDLSASPVKIVKGNSVNLQVRLAASSILAGSGRTVSVRLEKSGSNFTGISARGDLYNIGLVADDGATNWDGTATAQGINAGSLSVVKSSKTPATGNLAPGAQDEKLAAWDITVKGEQIRSTSLLVDLDLATMVRTEVTGCTLKDGSGAVVAGPVDASANPDVTFSTTITFPTGTNTYSFHCNIASTVSNLDTIDAGTTAGGFTLTGVTSGNTVTGTPATEVEGNTLTVQGSGLTITNLGTPPESTKVSGAQMAKALSVNLSAAASSSGENVRVTQVIVTDTTGATGDADDIANIYLRDDAGKDLSPVQQPAAAGTAVGVAAAYTFVLDTPLEVPRDKDMAMHVYVDVKAGIAAADIGATETHTFAILVVGDVTATGVTTGTTVAAGSKAISGAGQALTLASAGTLTTSADSSTPTSGIVVAGKSGVTLSVYRFVGAAEKVQLRRVVVSRADLDGVGGISTNAADGRDADVSKLYLYDGDTLLASAVLSGGTATFDITAKNFVMDELGNPKKLTLKGDFNTTLAGAVSGDALRFDLTAALATATGAPLGLSSGGGLALGAVGATLGTHNIRKSKPTFSKGAKNTAALIPGTMTYYLNITADAAADISFRTGNGNGTVDATEGALVFTVSGTANGDTTVGTQSIVLSKDNRTLSTRTTTDLDTSPLVFDFGNTAANLSALTVAAGTTEEVQVRVNLTSFSTAGNTWQLELSSDSTAAVETTSSALWFDDTAAAGSRYDAFGLTELPITHAWVKA